MIECLRRLRERGVGVSLDDFGTGPRGIPAALLNWCMAAKLAGARLGFVSVGAGPIRHPLSRWLMRTAAALADLSTAAEFGSVRRRDIGAAGGANFPR